MGIKKNKKYHKNLQQQAYERLKSMISYGQSKKESIKNGTNKEKIFSFNTYKAYRQHVTYFIIWINEKHPECRNLKSAKKYVNTWLKERTEYVNEKGEHYSAWTIQTEEAALNKLYGIDKTNPDRFQAPKRNRYDIKRSRGDVVRDRNFSKANNDELIKFCKGTGCRRNVLESLRGQDLWSRNRMEKEIKILKEQTTLSAKESAHLHTLTDALEVFPDYDYFLHHRKDKNGRYRFAPIIGPDKDKIIKRMKNTGPHEKVWYHVNSNADIHSYRAEYATAIYKKYARNIKDIPYDRINKGTGKKFQSDVYTCRKDEKGKKLDKVAMKKCSKALGHNRICIVADNYLRGL